MKAFLIFMGLATSLCAVFTAAILFARGGTHDGRVAGAVRFVEQQIVASATGNRGAKLLYTAAAEPSQHEPGVWTVTGGFAVKRGAAAPSEGTFLAIIMNTCDSYGAPRCWHLKSLMLGDLDLGASATAEAAAPPARPAAAETLPPAPSGSGPLAAAVEERDGLLHIVRGLNSRLADLEHKVATLELENGALERKLRSAAWEHDWLSDNFADRGVAQHR